MFASRNLHWRFVRCLSSLFHTNPPRDAMLFGDLPQKFCSNYVIYKATSKIDYFPPSYHFNYTFGSCRWMSTARGRSMRSKVEARMRKESSKTLKEIRRAKKLRLNLMTDEERLIYSLRRAKKKVALLLQKLKKYELPELPPPKHDPELLTTEQVQAYKKIGFRNRNYVPVGVLCCDNFPKEKIKEMATMLARLSGGIVINIHNVKTIIMFRGRNYRQPKNLIPVNTLTKRKALFKARFEQALESQKLNIKKVEQQLRRKGINPDDPVAMASIQRVASTFFNAIDKKEGSPYVFRGDEVSKLEPLKSFELSEPAEDSDQEELDKFIAEIEDAADKEWAAEEAAEKDEFDKIRYWNREDSGGRFRQRDSDSDDETNGEVKGRKYAHWKQKAAKSDDAEAISDGIDVWESNDEDGGSEFEEETDEDSYKHSLKVGRGRTERTGGAYHEEDFKRDDGSKFRRKMSDEEPELEAFSDLENAMWDSDSGVENSLGAPRPAGNNYHSSSDEEEDHNLLNEEASSKVSGIDAHEIDGNISDEAEISFQQFSHRRKEDKEGYSRKVDCNDSESDDTLSDSETATWEPDDVEDFDFRTLRAVDDDYSNNVGEADYSVEEDKKNRFPVKEKMNRKLEDETWDSD
ncbi:hypothetical protein Nepgr_026716 [Nepenthes gracilis]|uniref:CRM domain-containing protein n=1 Tax=Nepenthes gracilis TaxID=150966 RepID=A0AAD3T7N6_NEPGR|nr:hypothetical protein Nepgr_026716 [Nepenthes gracilis]